MEKSMALLLSVLEQGMIYGILALGVYITYKILDFPDLTVDGSFPFGAAITVHLFNGFGVPAILTLPIAFLGGALVGICTGLIHVKLKVRDLLSGIIMMTGLYTINLWVAGSGYVAIFDKENIFNNSFVNSITPSFLSNFKNVIIIFLITMVAKYLLDWYMSTKSGFLLRAVGDNDTIVTSLGVDKGLVKIVGLSIANGLVSLSGCIYAQQQRSFEISIGTGAVVIGLASVIIGTSLFKKVTFFRVTSSVVVGSILYKACVAVAMFAGISPNAIKLITAVLFLIILVVSMDIKKGESMLELININKNYNPGSVNELCLFRDFNLTVKDGEFVSVVGSNGSGKTSMLNIICGSIAVDSGKILIHGEDITRQKDYIRQRRIGRVYQDPSKGTCPGMTILENMSIAENKGKPYNLGRGVNKAKLEEYREMLRPLNLGLEDKMGVQVGSLSGGQRQALALLMATMTPIDFLILDEHTAALDPKTAEIIMELTDQVVKEKKVTTIMVTHNLRYAVEYGNRLIMMHEGKAILDKAGEEKKTINTEEIMAIFNRISVECGN